MKTDKDLTVASQSLEPAICDLAQAASVVQYLHKDGKPY